MESEFGLLHQFNLSGYTPAGANPTQGQLGSYQVGLMHTSLEEYTREP